MGSKKICFDGKEWGTQADIAYFYGVSPKTVSRWIQKEVATFNDVLKSRENKHNRKPIQIEYNGVIYPSINEAARQNYEKEYYSFERMRRLVAKNGRRLNG